MTTNLIILDGPSGSGKSSLAKSLQEQLLPDVWLNFSIDNIIYTLPGSILDRCNNENDWAGVDSNALFAGAFACLAALLNSNNRVIFDLVITSQAQAGEIKQMFGRYKPIIFGVTCEWHELTRRTLNRGDRTLQESEYGFKNSPHLLDYDAVVDTTKVSAQAAASFCMQYVKQQHN